jgi:hypothetical protein
MASALHRGKRQAEALLGLLQIVLQTAHLTAKSPEGVFSPIRSFQQVRPPPFVLLVQACADVSAFPSRRHQAEYVESVALEAGLELFDWGRIVSPLSNEMTDGLHFVPGVASWLWVRTSFLLPGRTKAWADRLTRSLSRARWSVVVPDCSRISSLG